ncbi:hypothetical protein VF724_00950 [Paenibacillaceae bacterium T2]|uniref:Uncharacterized protein n=1 Tax=Ferviditalea candida TaxID=3108399 RepID=A0ABU5ZCJ2_9BACL|nr:hypothetical protein [Paenibacillaceae bacterium T2]
MLTDPLLMTAVSTTLVSENGVLLMTPVLEGIFSADDAQAIEAPYNAVGKVKSEVT